MSRPVHIVSHSHWDREWHLTFQQFRMRLVHLIDDLLDLQARAHDFAHFMLDGQTIMLDDYVEVRPERARELREQIAAGRLLIGPWYDHPDEFLVSGEAIVRNLLLGTSACAAWGAPPMAVGYVPDQFGHIAQLPQILRGFGIETAVLWRGVDRARAGIAFTWEGPDGSTVLAAALPYGYNQAERLPVGGQAAAERLQAIADALESLATPDQPLLIMNGGDHVGVQQELPGILRAAQEVLGTRLTILHSTLPRYLEALAASSRPETTLRGELRDSRSAFLLPAVLSSRMWIKQRNAALQTLLEREAEPLATIAAALGDRYPAGELRQSWRYLLQNQPHDSICGCSIDQVHREMVTRYDWGEQIAVALRDEALAGIAGRVRSLVQGNADPRTLAITVFNGAPAAQGGRIDLHLRLTGEAASYELVDTDGAAIPHQWLGEHGEPPTMLEVPREEVPDGATMLAQVEGDRVMGMGLMAVSLRTVGDALHAEITIGDQALLDRQAIEAAVRDAFALADEAGSSRAVLTIHRSSEFHLAALVPHVPSCGYRTLLLRPRARPATVAQETHSPELYPAIENERFRVEADPESGTVMIIHRASGMRLGPVNFFVDGGDAGDLYTHCPPAADMLIGPQAHPTIERVVGPLGGALQIHATLLIPKCLDASGFGRSEERVAMSIETCVSLAPADPLIRFHTVVHNTAEDHRLRVHTALPFATDHSHAADAFGIVRRPAQPDRAGEWAEAPVGTAPHQGVVAVHGEGASCVLAAHGLPEYEVVARHDGTAELALTLLRCTGWLSRGYLPNRPGPAGPSLRTPEAQCLGTHRFDYALAFGPEPWPDLMPAAGAFAVSLRPHVAPCREGTLPAAASLIAVTPAAVMLSTLKAAEDGRGAILRLYNTENRPHTATISSLIPVATATMVTLGERDEALLFEGEARTAFDAPLAAAHIVSIRLEWAPA